MLLYKIILKFKIKYIKNIILSFYYNTIKFVLKITFVYKKYVKKTHLKVIVTTFALCYNINIIKHKHLFDV